VVLRQNGAKKDAKECASKNAREHDEANCYRTHIILPPEDAPCKNTVLLSRCRKACILDLGPIRIWLSELPKSDSRQRKFPYATCAVPLKNLHYRRSRLSAPSSWCAWDQIPSGQFALRVVRNHHRR